MLTHYKNFHQKQYHMKKLSSLYLVRTQDILFDAVEFQRIYRENPFVLGDAYLTPLTQRVQYLSMCCMERYCTRWVKGVKYASPSIKGFSRYIRWNSTASKRISCVHKQNNEVIIFIGCCIWRKFSSALAYTPQPYSEAMAMRPKVTYTPLHHYREIGRAVVM